MHTKTAGEPITRKVWAADMERLRPALVAHVITVDGEMFLNPETCPPELSELHARLLAVGYANGFIS